MTNQRAHLWIRGYVQGVSFRYYTRQQGTRLGLTGWVKNLPDGRVEVVAEGEAGALQAFVDWCHQGPPIAEVEEVELRWETYRGEFGHFRIAW